MRKLESVEIKQILVSLLKEIKQVCEEHKIKYFLSGGTLLGAVLYKGFIPWDDDIDLLMPREDYNKFIELQKKGLLKHTFHCCELNKKYKYPFGKYCDDSTVVKEKLAHAGKIGVYVDVFPLDGLSSSIDEARYISMKQIRRYVKLYQVCLLKPSYAFLLCLTPLVFPLVPILLSRRRILKKIQKIATKHSFYKSDYVGEVVNQPLAPERRLVMRKEVFSDTVNLPFTDDTYPAPIGFEEYLQKFYRPNYRDPNPEHLQKNHGFAAYKKNDRK